MTEEQQIELLPEPIKTNAKAFMRFKPDDLPENPDKNKWYAYRPEGCVCSDGSPYYSTLKIGTENKLLVMFCGGGVALDEYSAARPNTYIPEEGKPTFYGASTFVIGYFTGHNGVANKDRADNPFKNWSVVVLSYASGDFHTGTVDCNYDDSEMGKGICQHHGYTNYRAMMKKIIEFVPNPEQVLVTGYSAGGWATALLTDDVISLFPNCNNFSCLVDSGLASYKKWKQSLKQWGTPEHIARNSVSDNIVLDSLLALNRKYGKKVKIAFGSTYRDALLAQEQSYCDEGKFVFTDNYGDRIQQILTDTVATLNKEIPNLSLYVFDKPHPEVKNGKLTEHTFVAADYIYDYAMDGVKIIDWIESFAEGKPKQIGLRLLGK